MSFPDSSPEAVFFIGLDVSSRDCWAAVTGKKPKRFPLSPAGAAALAEWVASSSPAAELRAVLEHTGVYSSAWASLLRERGITCALCNPKQIRHFAVATGQRSKTDKADAKSILAFALHSRPAVSVELPQAQQDLDLLIRERDRTIKKRVALDNQLQALAFTPQRLALVQPELQQEMAMYLQIEASLDAKIAAQMKSDERLCEANRLLRGMDGIGPVTSSVICSQLDRILDCNQKQLTALAGLAPSHRESGSSVRGRSRIDKEGRPQLRKCLYMAAMTACQHCPKLIALKARLDAKGKPGKVVLIAIARHLLLMAQDVLKKGLLPATST